VEYQETERRKETRYPVEARVTVHKRGGGTVSAIAANISSAGMLLHVEQPLDFCEGEAVTVEVELPDNPGAPFSAWGLATVARIDRSMFAVRLQAGTFDERNP
jgi:hypothetical protein